MEKKFALITDDKVFSTDSGYKIITYNSPWDSMGWTALKELSLEAADLIANILRSEGYGIAYTRDQLDALRNAEIDRTIARQRA